MCGEGVCCCALQLKHPPFAPICSCGRRKCCAACQLPCLPTATTACMRKLGVFAAAVASRCLSGALSLCYPPAPLQHDGQYAWRIQRPRFVSLRPTPSCFLIVILSSPANVQDRHAVARASHRASSTPSSTSFQAQLPSPSLRCPSRIDWGCVCAGALTCSYPARDVIRRARYHPAVLPRNVGPYPGRSEDRLPCRSQLLRNLL